MSASEVIGIITGITGVAALIVGVATIAIDGVRRRRQATLDAYVQAGPFKKDLIEAEGRTLGNSYDPRRDLSLEDAFAMAATYSPDHEAILHYLDYWEDLAIGARVHVYDKKVLRLISQHRIVSVYQRYAAYIYFTRWYRSHERLYEALEKLAVNLGAARPDVLALAAYYAQHIPVDAERPQQTT